MQIRKLYFLLFLFVFNACSSQSSVSARYLTAEKLWTEKKYIAAVVEFDRIVKENPGSALAVQSLWRASTTRALFLNDYPEALHGLQQFIDQSAQKNLIIEAQREIGEILFSKTQQYQQAIEHYEKLIQSKSFSSEEEFLLFRISRSYVALGKIKKAIATEETTLLKFPQGKMSTRIKIDLAQNWFTIGEVEKLANQKALALYKEISSETKNKNQKQYIEAQFGQAIVLEEMDKLEEAMIIYKNIESDYEVPNIVKIRMKKINDRTSRKKI